MYMLNRRNFLTGVGAGVGGLATASVLGPQLGFASATAGTSAVQPAPRPLLLNYNENALGMSPRAREAAEQAVASAYRYPDAIVGELIGRLSQSVALPENNILLGAGSNQNLKMAVDATLSGGDGLLVTAEPTFGSPVRYAKARGARVAKVPLDDAFKLDLVAMQKAAHAHDGPVLVYLCNPNNPTATVVNSGAIETWVSSAPENVFFLIDEAYHEFVTAPEYRSAVSLIKAGHKNLTVARTFSKIYGMAGLRIGYSVAEATTTRRLARFISADNVNAAGLAAANASLADEDWYTHSLGKTDEARNHLYRTLDDLDLAYVPSQANFVLHRITGELKEYQRRMHEHGVFVGRSFPRTAGWNRLSLGTTEEMVIFSRVLKDFRGQGWV